MKTTKFVALAALGLALPALASTLQSANIVGYQTMPLESGTYTMFSVPFVHVNNDGKGLMLNSDLTFANLDKTSVNALASDQIWIWVPAREAYDKFYYYYESEDEKGWSYLNSLEEPYFEEVYPDGLPAGAAMYYKGKSKANKSVTGAGAIDPSQEVELPLISGTYTMVANPYPVAMNINDETQVEFKGLTATSANSLKADQIWIWVPAREAYDKFYYYYESEQEKGWSYLNSLEEPYFEEVYKGGLPSGMAFYYKAMPGSGKSVIFKSPIK